MINVPTVRTRQCRFPTTNWGRETALPYPPRLRLLAINYFEAGKRHCRVRPCYYALRLKKPGFLRSSVAATKYSRKKPGFWVPVLSPNFKKILHRELK